MLGSAAVPAVKRRRWRAGGAQHDVGLEAEFVAALQSPCPASLVKEVPVVQVRVDGEHGSANLDETVR